MPKSNITIKDIAVVAQSDDLGAPVGEARFADRGSSVEQIYSSVDELIEQAKQDHERHSQGDSSYITRLSTNEFYFYTKRPLTLQEFDSLQSTIADKMQQLPPGIQLILGTFAVRTSDNKVMNVAPHISSGDPPEFNFIVKNYTNSGDVSYPKGDGAHLYSCDSHSAPKDCVRIKGKDVPFTLNNVVSCKTADNMPFITIIDICLDHYMAVGKNNFETAAKSNPELLNQPVSHVVVSNTIDTIPENSIGLVMQVDPYASPVGCKKEAVQTQSPAVLRHKFGPDDSIILHVRPQLCLSVNQAQQEQQQEQQTINELLNLPNAELAKKMQEHSDKIAGKLVKFMDLDRLDKTFVDALQQKYAPSCLPLDISFYLSVAGKKSLLSDIEVYLAEMADVFLNDAEKTAIAPERILFNISKDGPLTPELAVKGFPNNHDIFKKACELDIHSAIRGLSDPINIDLISQIDPMQIKVCITKGGPITPMVAIEAFPDKIEVIKAACERAPRESILALSACAVEPNLVISHISKDGPITARIAINAFPNDVDVITKACSVDPEASSSALYEAKVNPQLVIQAMSITGPVTPVIAIKAFPQNEEIIKSACQIDSVAAISAVNECKTNPDLIVKNMSKDGPITPGVAIKMVQGNQSHIAQVLSKELIKDSWASDVKQKATAAIDVVATFLAKDNDLSIKEHQVDDKTTKLLLELHRQYQKLNKESSDMHKQKKEVIIAAMKSLVTGDVHYLATVLGKNNDEHNQEFGVRKYIPWGGVSQTEALAIRTLSQVQPADKAPQTNPAELFKEAKGNFKKLLSNHNNTQTAAEKSNANDCEMEAVSSYHKLE